MKLLINTLPAGEQVGRQFDIKLVDHPINGLIDDVFHAFRLVVNAGTGGMITAPISAAWVINRRCPKCSGVSRTHSANGGAL